MKHTLENTDNLSVRMAEVVSLIEKGGKICGAVTACGARLYCKAIVLATGVYLKSRCIIGEYSYEGGPSGLMPATGLSHVLRDLGFELRRFRREPPQGSIREALIFQRPFPNTEMKK